MWARMVVAPWWLRWLVDAAVAAVALTAIVAAILPTFVATTGLWGLVALLGFSLAAAAPIVLVQTSVQRSYAAALAGLTLEQRTQTVKALRGGQVPSDPRVLAAAIRVGTISRAYGRRAARWQKTAIWWLPATYAAGAVVFEFTGNTRQALLWAGFALLFAALFAWRSYRSRRLPQHVERLRAAATEIPEAASAAADTEDSVALAPRRMKTAVLLLIAVAIAFGTAVYLWAPPRQSPDCRTADNVVTFIYAHCDLLDAGRITPGDPSLKNYQDWSEQLQTTHGKHQPDILRHLHRIAELSVQAVTLVQDTRKDPVASSPPGVIRDHQIAYQKTTSELIAQDDDLVPICHPHG